MRSQRPFVNQCTDRKITNIFICLSFYFSPILDWNKEAKSNNNACIFIFHIFSFILSISMHPYQYEIIFYSKWYENRYNHLKNAETVKRTPYFQHHCNFNPISSSCWTAVNILLTWIHIFCNLFPSDPWWSSLEKRTQRSN